MTSRNLKQYLGDSVYADHDGQHVVLTTENGFGASNTIYLEPEVITKLGEYVAWVAKQRVAWDQADGVWCEKHSEDATLCPCSGEEG